MEVSRSAVVELKRRVEMNMKDHAVATQTSRRLQIELASKLPFIENKMVEAQERETATHNARLLEHGLRLDLLDCKTTNDVLLWKITDVKRRRRDAVTGKTPSIYSQPFYTSPNGYKLCVRMYRNGDGIGRTTYLSLFVVVMRGEYNILLEWPLHHQITFILVDQTAGDKYATRFNQTRRRRPFGD
ncbi:TNF receptor-associated factor 3-like [Corticium candelabrum]|uniref:TNF receptor-associated factor 3-like n=1 Tax=Corticium candelabrum TaxID=121492 RepID=UPI002E25DD62|nr:TNF receptor-associated factor 3-like [Corticium candelabrum]